MSSSSLSNANHVSYDIPAARAILRDVRVTPTKARRVVDLIRGRSVSEAQAILSFAPQAAAEPVLKLLNSAVANAEARLGESADALSVYRAFVDEGQTWKRMRPRSRSQAFRILKRSSHITVVVASTEAAAAAAGRPVTSHAARARLSNPRTSSKTSTASSGKTASSSRTAKKTSSKNEKVNS
jgi:large subunit ribosomal protein L22